MTAAVVAAAIAGVRRVEIDELMIVRTPVILGGLAFVSISACRSEALPSENNASPSASVTESTKIVVSERLDAALPACTVHFVSDAFSSAHATPAGTVRVEGDYTRTLAKVAVTPTSLPAWSGTFSGPRDALVDVVKQHLCATASVYALKADGNKDPTKGAVTLTAFAMTPDEKGDVDALCNAYTRAPNVDAGDVSLRDRAAMAWAEDALTTTRWDTWRRGFAHELADAYARKADTKDVFTKRAGELEAASSALGTKCDTAAQWKKR